MLHFKVEPRYHNIDEDFVTKGGDFHVYALQLRYAITDQDGWADVAVVSNTRSRPVVSLPQRIPTALWEIVGVCERSRRDCVRAKSSN